MAKKDVKEYYYHMQAQYLELKNDLADFEQALRDGFITDDKLTAVKDEIAELEKNYDRLRYIIYLLDLPALKFKHKKYNKVNKQLLAELERVGASKEQVIEENKTILAKITAMLEKITGHKRDKK